MRTSSVLSIAPRRRPRPGFVLAAGFLLAGILSAREPQLVKDPTGRPAGYDPSEMTQVGDRLFFIGFDPERYGEIWVTDGTQAGTRLVRNTGPGPSYYYPRGLAAFAGKVFFSAWDFEAGRELWLSDGTDEGTTRLKDIWPGRYPPLFGRDEPYSSHPGRFTPLGDRLLFVAADLEHGGELWVTDGTEAGTRILKDIYPGDRSSGPMGWIPPTLVLAWDRVFFNAHEPEHGTELWITDGTEVGTMLLKDIWPGWRYSDPGSFTVAGDRLYFLADYPDCGRELWVTDGTEAGTVFLADACPGLGLGVCDPPDRLTPLGNHLYFTAVDPEHGEELWITDGTETGTRLVADIYPGPRGSWPSHFTPLGDRLFFVADDAEGSRRLWVLFVGSPEIPWASFSREPRGCEPGRKILFDGTRSFPGKGLEIVRYEWRIGEVFLEGPKVEFELPQRVSGPLKVCLTVTNGKGLSDTSCEEICIADRFRRGDANADGKINISDAVTILGYLFLGGAAGCLDAADADDGGTVNLADAVALLEHLFRAGPALPAPYPDCGADPTPDDLGCAFYPRCP